MNQRLLERLQRHGAFPQARPDTNGAPRSDSVRPFGVDRPRLALSQQPSSGTQPSLIPQPLESEMAFANSPFVASAQLASPMMGAASAEILPTTRTEAQTEVAALEDFGAVADRSDFSEIPFALNNFSLSASTDEPTNTEAINANTISTDKISTDTISAGTINSGTINSDTTVKAQTKASPEIEASRSANQSAARAPNQLELTAAVRQALTRSEAPRSAGAQSAAPRTQPNSPPVQTPLAPSSDLLESQPSAAINSAAINEQAIAESRGSRLEPSEALASQETAGFAVSTANTLGLPPVSSSTEPAQPIQAPLRTESATAAQSPAQPNPSFDRKAAMLELSALGLKVRVTLSNAAMQTQLEEARAGALRASALLPAESAVGASALNRAPDRAVELDRLEGVALPVQIAATAREETVREDAAESRVGEVSPEASDAPLDPPATEGTRLERGSSAARPPTVSSSSVDSLETNPARAVMAERFAEIPAYGAVAAVEVYNPPNRRAAVTRPKIEEATKNQAETLFSDLPDSSPLEWLSRLGLVGAVDVAAPNPSQSLIAPARGLPNIGAAPIASALTNSALTNSAPANTEAARALLTPDAARNPSAAPRIEAAKLIAAVAPRVEPAPSNPAAANLPSAQSVAPQSVASSVGGSPSAPISSAIQRQGVSSSDAAIPTSLLGSTPQSSRPEPAVADAERKLQSGNEALERNADQRNTEQSNALEVTTAEITAADNLGALEQGSPLRGNPSQFSSPTTAERSAAEDTTRDITEDSQRILESALTSAATSSDAVPNASVPSVTMLDAPTSSDVRSSDLVSSDLVSSNLISSDQSQNLAGLDVEATGAARTALSVTGAAGETQSVTGQSSTTPSARVDFASQGTPAAVEMYNPPNRRVTVMRPKAEEAPKSEAETLFSTLPDSSPLEWLSRLGLIGAVELDSSSPSVAPALASASPARSADQLEAARPRLVSSVREPGSQTASDLNTAFNPRTTPDPSPARVVANPVQTGNALPVSSTQALEAQRRESQPLQVETSDPASSAGRLAAEYQTEVQGNQIGSGSRVAPLIAAPVTATPSSPQLIATPPQTAAPRATAPPVRLSVSAQRLIAPITGVDPNSVEIRRDAQSDALTRSYRADALTVDGAVLLSARMTAESPETLGVIAHELTHVARGRQPRFVPPALRLASSSAAMPSLEGLGEEGIALQVEGLTRALAQPGIAQSSGQPSGVNSSSSSGRRSVTPRSPESVPWSDGVLPAPWELMDRLEALSNPSGSGARNQNPQRDLQPAASQQPALQPARYASPVSVRSEAAAFAGGAANSSVSSSVAGGNFAGIGAAAPRSVQAAEQGRSVPTPSPAGPLPKSTEATQKPANGLSPAPDLDDLARQVYAVLKRRLITERRRSS